MSTVVLIIKEKDSFRIQIFEGENFEAKGKNLLDTEIELLEENRVVFGFKDNNGQIYFLSFFRKKDLPAKYSKKELEKYPDLLKVSFMKYPKEALEKGMEGLVVLEGSIDNNGNMNRIKAWRGKGVLVESVKKNLEKFFF